MLVVKSKILEGKSLDALQIIKNSFSYLIKEFPKLEFLLNTQHFIEMVKNKAQNEAIFFAREALKPDKNENFISFRENKIEEISLDVL